MFWDNISENYPDTIISIIVGTTLGYIFYWLLVNNVIYKGPDSAEIAKNIYQYNGKKYILESKVCPCPISLL